MNIKEIAYMSKVSEVKLHLSYDSERPEGMKLVYMLFPSEAKVEPFMRII